MSKATHLGTCQACGRQQMLPSGVLAAHGYEISHGFQNGVCMGAGHLPYEVSTDLIERSISHAMANADRLDRDAADHLVQLGEWVAHQVYHPELSSRTKGSVLLWEDGILRAREDGYFEFVQPTDASWSPERQGPGKPKVERLHGFGRLDRLVSEYRSRYAGALNSRADGQRKYATHQQRRLTDWQPQPLTPRPSK